MKVIFGKLGSGLFTVGGWVLFGARAMLDLIGYSTAPDDLQVAKTRLEQAFDYFLSIPWEALLGFALISTLWLIWVSWPRSLQETIPTKGNALEKAPDEKAKDKAPRPEPTPINHLENYFSKREIRVADLVGPWTNAVENKVFEDCTLFGPGVLILDATSPMQFDQCIWQIPPDSFIKLPVGHYVGFIVFRGCTFRRCKFIGVAVAGEPAIIDHMLKNISRA